MTVLLWLLVVCNATCAFASFMALRNWRLAAVDAKLTRDTIDSLSRVYWKIGRENARQREVIGAAIDKLNAYIAVSELVPDICEFTEGAGAGK